MLNHTAYTVLLHLVFASRVFLISFLWNRMVWQRARHILEAYPPSEYPRLYGVSASGATKALKLFRSSNRGVLFAGLGIVAYGLLDGSHELLGWDSHRVITLYGLLQFVPLILAGLSGLPYFGSSRQPDRRRKRTAELRPRRLFDFVSPGLVALAGVAFLVFVALVTYVRQFDFPWFGGYSNVAVLTVMNLGLAGVIARNLRGKPVDPYQTHDGRRQRIALILNIAVITSIATTTFAGFHIGLKALGLPLLLPLAHSLFLQILGYFSYRTFRIDEVDFEVYRDDQTPAVATA